MIATLANTCKTCAHQSNLVWYSGREMYPKGKFSLMILPQVHLRKPCYDFYFL